MALCVIRPELTQCLINQGMPQVQSRTPFHELPFNFFLYVTGSSKSNLDGPKMTLWVDTKELHSMTAR